MRRSALNKGCTQSSGAVLAAGLALLLDPARTVPLLPPLPWQQPPLHVAATTVSPLQQLTPGWQVTSLGNPAAGRYPACWQSLPRTPWALTLFSGELHIGLGNASNEGATANAGPVPLFSYSLSSGRWRQRAVLPEEEISRFVQHGGQLWIPGADPRGSWRWGNLYRRQAGPGLWWQQRRLPRFIHAYDLAWHQGQLVVAGNVADAVGSGPQSERHGSALASSSDAGRHWQVQRLTGLRATALLPVAGQLFALEALPGPRLQRWLEHHGRAPGFAAVHQWQADGSWLARRDISRSALLPAVPGAEQRFAWHERATPTGEAVAWISSFGSWQAHPASRDAFVARSLQPADLQVERLPLEPGELAMDLQANGAGWLLLSSSQRNATQWHNRISAVQIGPEGLSQQQLLSFQAPLPAWSLVADSNQMVVGLGHPPFQPEPTPGRCQAADQLSGTVLTFRRF
jgi:hypothetical protein